MDSVAEDITAHYLPVVALIAAFTLIIWRDPMAAVSALVVACLSRVILRRCPAWV